MSVSVERKPQKTKVITESQRHDKDTGGSEVQISLLSDRINYLTEHLKMHRTDFSTQRGLRKMIGQRTSLLQYLQYTTPRRYQDIVKRLGLRK